MSSQPQKSSEPSWPPQIELTLKYIGRSRFECAAMYLIEKSLTANRYPRQAIAVVMQPSQNIAIGVVYCLFERLGVIFIGKDFHLMIHISL